MNKNPLVSIITPLYNMEMYIEKTIESVLLQDYDNIEYIVINDGSTDNAKKLLEKYQDRVNIIHQQNIGQARTLNKGWKICKGDYIGYLSADDLLKKNAISSLVDKIKDTNYIVVYPDFDLIDANDRHIRNIETEDFNLERLAIDLVCQPGPGALFQKQIFESLGGWNENLSHVADFEFWLRAAKHGGFLRVPEILASFRIHEGSGSVKQIPKIKSNEIVEVMKEYWGDLEESRPRSRALSSAKIISARSHAQSGRYFDALKNWGGAIVNSPKKGLSSAAFRSMASGFFRRVFYRIRNKIR